MLEGQDYRDHVKNEFDHISKALEKISKSVEEIKASNIKIEMQTTLTNSRVTHLEDQRDKYLTTRVSTDMLKERDDKITDIKKCVEYIKNDLEEYRLLKKHPVLGIILVLVFIVGMGLSAFQTIKSVGGSHKNEEIIDMIKNIEYKLNSKLGVSPTTRSLNAYPDTTIYE